jgi:hypothetical protein
MPGGVLFIRLSVARLLGLAIGPRLVVDIFSRPLWPVAVFRWFWGLCLGFWPCALCHSPSLVFGRMHGFGQFALCFWVGPRRGRRGPCRFRGALGEVSRPWCFYRRSGSGPPS